MEYDNHFGVWRVAGEDPLSALGEATVVAYYRWSLDSLRGHSLKPAEIEALNTAFAAALSLVAWVPSLVLSEPDETLAWSTAPSEPLIDALHRWKIGHHVFFVLIQALLLSHTRLAVALDQKDGPAAREAFSISTKLWWGTAAAFRYTADFPATDCQNLLRPSTSPPFLMEWFSSFFSSDHAYLIRALKLLQPSLRALPPEFSQDHRWYLQALDATYEAHACGCETFVGEGHSLRAEHHDHPADGPAFIRHTLKRRTMAAAGHRAGD